MVVHVHIHTLNRNDFFFGLSERYEIFISKAGSTVRAKRKYRFIRKGMPQAQHCKYFSHTHIQKLRKFKNQFDQNLRFFSVHFDFILLKILSHRSRHLSDSEDDNQDDRSLLCVRDKK